MKYWQIILENLRNAGWNCGSMATTDGKGRPIWVVAAERSDAGRFIVHADQELPAFLELESAIKNDRHTHEYDCPEADERIGRSSLTISAKPDGVGAAFQPWTHRGERFGLWTRMAMESVSSCVPMKS